LPYRARSSSVRTPQSSKDNVSYSFCFVAPECEILRLRSAARPCHCCRHWVVRHPWQLNSDYLILQPKSAISSDTTRSELFDTVALAFLASALLSYPLPTVRTVIGPDGRRRSIAETPSRSFGYQVPPYARRNTIAAVDKTNATAEAPSIPPRTSEDTTLDLTRRNTIDGPPGRTRSSMSKVVRSVKNVTKGYSSVQVKVRNGTPSLLSGTVHMLTKDSYFQ